MRSRFPIKNERRDRQKKRRLILGSTLFFIFIISFVTSIYFASRLPRFLITEIEIDQNPYWDNADRKISTEHLLKGNYLFGLIPKNNIFLFPRNEIENNLSSPSIKNIYQNIDKSKLKISFDIRKPLIVWCGESSCVYVDESGFSFASAPKIDGDIYLIYKTSEDPVLSNQVISKTDLDNIIFIHKESQKFGLSFKSFSKISNTTIDFIERDTGMILKINQNNIPTETVSYLKTAFDTLKSKNISKNSIEYIDARFGNRIVFKEKE